jgi:glycerophosphoryl diester phosphodiesterase
MVRFVNSSHGRSRAGLAIVAVAGLLLSPTARAGAADRGPMVIAHRGGMVDTPESTIAAFRHSIAVGVDGIIFDVRFTSDGVPVVLHDETLNRTTDCSGAIERTSAEELRRCDAGAVDDDAYGFQHVPTLDQALDFIAAHSATARVFIHCKVVRDGGQAKALVDMVRDHGLNVSPRMTYLADSTDYLGRLSDAGADRLGLVFHSWNKDFALNSHYPVLLAWGVSVTRQDVELAEQHDQLLIASAGHPQSMDSLLRMGVPAVSVDDLDDSMHRLGRGGHDDDPGAPIGL